MAGYPWDDGPGQEICTGMAGSTRVIQDTLERLDAACRARMAEWTPDARRQYAIHSAQWNAAAGQLPAALGRARAVLGRIAQETAGNLSGRESPGRPTGK